MGRDYSMGLQQYSYVLGNDSVEYTIEGYEPEDEHCLYNVVGCMYYMLYVVVADDMIQCSSLFDCLFILLLYRRRRLWWCW